MMKTTRLALFVLIAFLLGAVSASAATYTIDGTHSSVLFKVTHFGASNFYGAFKDVSGTINYDPENLGASSVEVEIAANSVDSRNKNRDEHIMGPDFLNSAEFPKISFKSTGVKGSGDSFHVTGKLTLHGVTRDVTAEVEKVGEGKHPRSGASLIGFEARLTIDRTEFDMGFMAGPLSEEVELILSLEAGQQ